MSSQSSACADNSRISLASKKPRNIVGGDSAATLRIAQHQIVFTIPRTDDLPARVDSELAEAAKRLSIERAKVPPLPKGAPPELPRAILVGDGKVIQLSLTQLSIVATPPSHVANSLGSSLRYLQNLLGSSLRGLADALPLAQWAGLVTIVYLPQAGAKTAIEAIAPAVDKLVNVNSDGDKLVSFQLLYGIRAGPYFHNITIQGYESRRMTVHVGESASPIEIQVGSMPIIEAGIQLNLDVNSKGAPKPQRASEHLAVLARETESLYKTIPSKFPFITDKTP